jgi:hypothetical protein
LTDQGLLNLVLLWRCLRNGLRKGESHVLQAVRDALQRKDDLQTSVTIVVEAVSIENPSAIAPFKGEILGLLDAQDYETRRAAHSTAERIGAHPAQIDAGSSPLPAVYVFSFPPIDDGPLGGAGSLLPDLILDPTDLPELVRPFGPILAKVAQESGLRIENLLHRMSQIMRRLAPEDNWSVQAEKTLRLELEAALLHLPFRRPRATIARKALFHLVGELIDAGRLDTGKLHLLEPVLRFYDPGMLLFDPVARPAEIPAIAGREKFGGKNEKWLSEVDLAVASACRRTKDGRIVLAETTKLSRLDWEKATEVRLNKMEWVSSPGEIDSEEFFPGEFNLLMNEYSHLANKGAERSPVIRQDAYWYESPGKNWLALNPVVGRKCAWQLSKEGLFRWVDDSGGIMVESA